MRNLWRSWLRFEAWLLDGLLLKTKAKGQYPSGASRPGRTRRQTTAPPPWGSTSHGQTRSNPRGGAKDRSVSAAHLPFDLVAAYISIGLPHDASKAVVRQRLRQLMKEAHPDRHAPEKAERAARRMRELSRARDTLRRHGRLP